MTPEEREDAERLIDMILPVSQRYEGIRQDAINHENRRQLSLESISAPTIIVDAKALLQVLWHPKKIQYVGERKA